MTAQKRRAGGAYRQKSRMTALYAKPGKDRSKARKAPKSKRSAEALGTVEQLAGLAREEKSHETLG